MTDHRSSLARFTDEPVGELEGGSLMSHEEGAEASAALPGLLRRRHASLGTVLYSAASAIGGDDGW
jgi:hypothetical protein